MDLAAADGEAKKLQEVARTFAIGDAEPGRPNVDHAGIAAQLRAMGASPEMVARYEAKATEDAGDDSDDLEDDWFVDDDESEPESKRKKSIVVEVLECNWLATEVFLCCEPEWISGMQTVRQGISAKEIFTAVTLLRIPRTQWRQLIEDVQLMGRAAAKAQNSLIGKP